MQCQTLSSEGWACADVCTGADARDSAGNCVGGCTDTASGCMQIHAFDCASVAGDASTCTGAGVNTWDGAQWRTCVFTVIHGSNNVCWCVDPAGTELGGTRTQLVSSRMDQHTKAFRLGRFTIAMPQLAHRAPHRGGWSIHGLFLVFMVHQLLHLMLLQGV